MHYERDFEGVQQAHLARGSDGEPNRGGAQIDPTDDEELYREVYTGGVLVRGDLQKMIGETQGPVSRTESIFIIISIAIYYDLEVFKIDIMAAYLNTPMDDNVKHKWLMLDKNVVKELMSMVSNYWKTNLRRDGKILASLTRSCTVSKKSVECYSHQANKQR